jgi:hypothetical protein
VVGIIAQFAEASNVAGGRYNRACGSNSNVAGGYYNCATSYYSAIAGGSSNIASGYSSNVAGGRSNCASGNCSNVAGGIYNTACGNFSNVAGGVGNTASGTGSNVAGGGGYYYYSQVGSNTASGNYSNVAGGFCNQACAACSSILGGTTNTILSAHTNSFIVGSNITSSAACYTFVNNLSSQGVISANTILSGSTNLASVFEEQSSAIDKRVEFVNLTVNTAAGTAAKTTVETVTFKDGVVYNVRFTSGTTASTPTLNEVNIRLGTTNASATTLSVGADAIVPMRYDESEDKLQLFGSHRTGDSTDSFRQRWNTSVQAGELISRDKIVMEGPDGRWYPLVSGSDSTGTTKTINQQPFIPNGIILYNAQTSNISENGLLTTTNNYAEIVIGGAPTQRNFNQQSGWTAHRTVYLKGTINTDGFFVLDDTTSTSYMTQDIPTTEDGFVYIRFGIMRDTTTSFMLHLENPAYEFKNGQFRPYIGGSINLQAVTDTGNTTTNSLSVAALSAFGKIIGGSATNTATGADAAVLGGSSNTASGASSNVAGGFCNVASGGRSNVAGGRNNCASGYYSNVAGGGFNRACGNCSNIAGGFYNRATSYYSAIAGGSYNIAFGYSSNVAGGRGNCASGNCSNIAGGHYNTACGNYSNVAGGAGNTASGTGSNVAGGGGYYNYSLVGSNTASGNYSNVAGGFCNQACAACSSILGGTTNTICSTHSNSFIVGSNITSSAACHTFVNNLSSQGSVATVTFNALSSVILPIIRDTTALNMEGQVAVYDGTDGEDGDGLLYRINGFTYKLVGTVTAF